MLQRLFAPTASNLENALDTSGLRQRVIANNLANVNTPGFKRSEVPFSIALSKASEALPMQTTNPAHLRQVSGRRNAGQIIQPRNSSMRVDGNNVDVDFEMASLADNELRYAVLTELTGRYFRGLTNVINSPR